MRIAIAGGPKTGKTTLAVALAAETGLAVVSTDDFIELGWSEASARVAALLADCAARIVEGVAVPRALRKALAAHPDVKPIDRLIVLTEPYVPRTRGQDAMAAGVVTVLAEIVHELQMLGVEVERR